MMHLPQRVISARGPLALALLAALLAILVPMEALRLVRQRNAAARTDARARLEDQSRVLAERFDANLVGLLRDVLLPAMATSGAVMNDPPPVDRFAERIKQYLTECGCVRKDASSFRLAAGGTLEWSKPLPA